MNVKLPPSPDQLGQLLLFAGFDAAALLYLSQHCGQRSYAAGETLFFSGDSAEACLMVLQGEVIAFQTGLDGREQVLGRFGDGEVIDIAAHILSEEAGHSYNAKVKQDTDLFIIPQAVFTFLLQTQITFGKHLLIFLSRQTQALTLLASTLSLLSVKARLARFLLAQADRAGGGQNFTQEEIAAEIGTVRDVVGRLLREFESEGCLLRQHHQIKLTNRSALEACADGENCALM